MLHRVTDGCLDVTENGKTTTFGSPSSDIRARVEILRPAGVDDAHARLDRLCAGLHRRAVDDGRPSRGRARRRAQHAPARPDAKALASAARQRAEAGGAWSRETRRTAPATTSRRTTTSGNDLFESFLDDAAHVFERVLPGSRRRPSRRRRRRSSTASAASSSSGADDHLIEIGTGGAGWRSTPRPSTAAG